MVAQTPQPALPEREHAEQLRLAINTDMNMLASPTGAIHLAGLIRKLKFNGHTAKSFDEMQPLTVEEQATLVKCTEVVAMMISREILLAKLQSMERN